MYALAAASGLGAMVFADTAPAVLAPANALIRAGVAASVTLVASRARRWTWLVLAGVAALLAESGVWLGVAGIGLGIAFFSVLRPRRRIYGAGSAAFAAQGLFHATGLELGRATPLVCALAVLPVFVSMYQVSPSRVRRRIRIAGLAGVGAVALATLVWGAAAGLAAPKVSEGAADAKAGLELARDGKTDQASAKLGDAAGALSDAHDLLSGFWVQPALAIPVLAQQAHALDVGTEQGLKLALQGAVTARKVDYESLRYQKDRGADLGRIRDAQGPLRDTTRTLEQAEVALDEVLEMALVGPVRSQLNELFTEIQDAKTQAQTASMAADAAPSLLGGDGARNYFVLFTTPAEQRGIGGFMGDWAILTADDGKLKLTESGRAEDLNKKLEGLRIPVQSDEDYRLRYQRWFVPNFHVQDVTVSPDFPTVSKVVQEVYPQAGGIKIDGTLLVDPYALAALLDITGPIEVDGYPEELSKDNVVDILLNRQYTEFTDLEARRQFLQDALRKPFDELTEMSLPAPTAIASKLGPPVEQRHLMFWSFDEREQPFLDRIGLSGRYGKDPDASDFIGITSQNSANNKIDVFLERKIDYRVTVDPASGLLDAKVKITLTNTAPASGLPDAVLGSNDQGYALGTNSMYFSVYTPHGLRLARVDGEELGVEYQKEAGLNVYSTRIVLDAGATAEVEMELFGRVPAGRTYSLDYIPQPLVNADQLDVDVSTAPLWLVARADADREVPFGVDPDGTRALLSAAPRERVGLDVGFRRR